MTMPVFGTLEQIDPKSLFVSEPQGFTPWLEANIGLLNAALGLEIEVRKREQAVGAFSVDLYGAEIGSGRPVIIENQLTTTDHDHMGKLLTYAGGLDAQIVVWVAPLFRDEHRKAIDWLNAHTTEEAQFFAVETSFVRIGTSEAAPLFRVVAQPSEWRPSGASAGSNGAPTERRLKYFGFFEDLLVRLHDVDPGFTSRKNGVYDSWMGFGSGRTGFPINAAFVSGNRFRVELYIDVEDQAANKAAIASLQQDAASIQAEIDEPLHWDPLPNRRAARVYVEQPHGIDSDDEMLESLKDWAVTYLRRFKTVFSPRVQKLMFAAPMAEADE
ncbi:MAG: DUF4268 domain-containing protein [Dehalococcoidia bacterium]